MVNLTPKALQKINQVIITNFIHYTKSQLVVLVHNSPKFICFGTVFPLENLGGWPNDQFVAMLTPTNNKYILELESQNVLLTINTIALKQLDYCIGCRVSYDEKSNKNALQFAKNFQEAIVSLCAMIEIFDPVSLSTPPKNHFAEPDWTTCNGCSVWSRLHYSSLGVSA